MGKPLSLLFDPFESVVLFLSGTSLSLAARTPRARLRRMRPELTWPAPAYSHRGKLRRPGRKEVRGIRWRRPSLRANVPLTCVLCAQQLVGRPDPHGSLCHPRGCVLVLPWCVSRPVQRHV